MTIETEVREEKDTVQKKTYSAGCKRYSPAQKKEIIEYVLANGVQTAAEKFGATGPSIYECRHRGAPRDIWGRPGLSGLFSITSAKRFGNCRR